MAPSLYQKSNETFFDQIQLENERNEFSLEGVPSGIWGSKNDQSCLESYMFQKCSFAIE